MMFPEKVHNTSSCVLTVVLEGKYARAFAQVFEQVQNRLESVFRMTLVELPAKEKHQTLQQQRRSISTYAGLTCRCTKESCGSDEIVDSNVDSS
jgi:MAGE family